MSGNGEKRERGTGRTYQRGKRWWIEYWFRGRQFRESGGDTEPGAKKLLKKRLKEIAGDRFVGLQEERLTIDQLCDSLITHLETKGSKSVRSYKSHLKPVREFFSLMRAVDLTTSAVEKFTLARLAERRPATVNRETGALRQALNLARKQGRLTRVPYIPMLREDNARSGFFEPAEFESVVRHLPEPVGDIARFAYLTGWRKSEITGLRWEDVDQAGREIRLRTSKNGHGRLLPLTGELLQLVEQRRLARQFTTSDGQTGLSDFVFHKRGESVIDFKKSWASACAKAGVQGRLFHDFRRTAVRDMVRAGVPQSVAMAISGHRTVSVFMRYNITSSEDMRQAIGRTADYRAAQPVERNVIPFPAGTGSH